MKIWEGMSFYFFLLFASLFMFGLGMVGAVATLILVGYSGITSFDSDRIVLAVALGVASLLGLTHPIAWSLFERRGYFLLLVSCVGLWCGVGWLIRDGWINGMFVLN